MSLIVVEVLQKVRYALLHYLDELPQDEIARQLGWSRKTVGKKLAQIRAKAHSLARSLGEEP